MLVNSVSAKGNIPVTGVVEAVTMVPQTLVFGLQIEILVVAGELIMVSQALVLLGVQMTAYLVAKSKFLIL